MYVVNYDRNRIVPSTPTQSRNWLDRLFNGEEVEPIIERENTVKYTRTYELQDVNEPDISVLAKLAIINRLIDEVPVVEYRTFDIPKKTHGYRTINAPVEEAMKAMRSVAHYLGLITEYKFHNSAWAYVPGRDVVGAMKTHADNKSRWFLKIDLKKFFDSCTPTFIEEQLMQVYPFGYIYEHADETKYEAAKQTLGKLIRWCTLEGLPQGTPISPILTNIIMIPIDYQITKLLNDLVDTDDITKQRYVYTRYADDIIISAKTSFDYQKIVNSIRTLLRGTPLNINNEKTRYGSSAGRNWNLGVMYNKDNKVTVGYKRKQQIKVIVNNFIKDGETWDFKDLCYLQGQLSWIKNVEPDYYNGLIRYLNNKYNKDVIASLIAMIKSKINN